MSSPMTREELIGRALGYADDGYVCAESVFMALADLKGVRSELVPGLATGLGGGMGCAGQVCGALSGAVLGLGLWFGRSEPVEKERRPYWFAGVLLERWKETHGETSCPGLLQLDLSVPADHERFDREGMWERACKPFIAQAAGLAYDVIAEEG